MRVTWLAPLPYSAIAGETTLSPFGSTHPAPWLQSLLGALIRSGSVDLTVVAPTREVRVVTELAHGGARFIFVPASRGAIRLGTLLEVDRRRLVSVARMTNPQVVHGHGTESECGIAATTCGLPSVLTIQGLMTDLRRVNSGGTAWKRAWYAATALRERAAIRKCDAVIAHTEYIEGWIALLSPGKRVFRIPNVAAVSFFSGIHLGTADGQAPYFVYVGRLDALKGHSDLLEAFFRVSAVYPDVRLRMICPSGPSADVERVIARKNLSHMVTVEGPLSSADVARAMSGAVALVHPSHADNFPTAVLEALTLGCPVIASRVGGLPDMIEDRRTGLLFRPGDILELTGLMLDVLSGVIDAGALGRAARSHARACYSGEVVARATLACYEEVRGRRMHHL